MSTILCLKKPITANKETREGRDITATKETREGRNITATKETKKDKDTKGIITDIRDIRDTRDIATVTRAIRNNIMATRGTKVKAIDHD